MSVCAALWAADPSWQAGLLQLPVLIAMPALIAILASRSTGCTRTFFVAMLTVMLFAAMSQCEALFHSTNSLFRPMNPYANPYYARQPAPDIVSHWNGLKNALGIFSGDIHGTLVLWFVAVLAGAISAAMHRLVAWVQPRG